MSVSPPARLPGQGLQEGGLWLRLDRLSYIPLFWMSLLGHVQTRSSLGRNGAAALIQFCPVQRSRLQIPLC